MNMRRLLRKHGVPGAGGGSGAANPIDAIRSVDVVVVDSPAAPGAAVLDALGRG